MGFYIHSCVKMRYKADFSPSSLACPETGEWVPVEECKRRLDKTPYTRFADADVDFSQQSVTNHVKFLMQDSEAIRSHLPKQLWPKMGKHIVVPFRHVSRLIQSHLLSDVKEWAALVGHKALTQGHLLVDLTD